MTTPSYADLADTPVVTAAELVADATSVTPARTVPKMPPPAGLLEGEQRAADGGVEPAPTE